jgi:predicted SAM-dependent methyltransferase
VEHILETLQGCPSCGFERRERSIDCRDYTFSKAIFNIESCVECGLLFTNPRPTESSIGVYYNSPEYVSHTDTQKGLLFRLYRKVKLHTLRKKRKYVESITKERVILDYGAGSGDFCLELSTNGWRVMAFEPDAEARELIRKKTPSVEMADQLSLIPDKSVSIITLWHVLEHVHQLNETLEQFKRILRTDGKLIIAVPNHRSFDAKHYGENWAAYDVPRHLYHFDCDSMGRLMFDHKFKLIDLKPMWFDSFYVSLLSEKNLSTYRGGNWLLGWPATLLVGLISNLATIFSVKRCSSITYTFENTE